MKTIRPYYGRRLIIVFLALLLLLSACSTQEPEPTEEPTAVADTIEEAEATATDVPPTAAPEPTAEPTEEPTEEPEPTAEPEPTEEPTAEPTEEPEAVFETSDAFSQAACEFDVPSGRDVICGWLTVPEDHFDAANENEIQLHVAIFSSESDEPAADPIVYLEGGPGGEPLETIPFTFERRFSPYLASHDLIMFDQRGTGYSQPSLACPENAALGFELLEQDISIEEATSLAIDTLFTCRARLLDEGVNLAAYNSAQSAADLNALREALGYDEWNVWGISYGTRLAQTVMRDQPAGVRSVILDSTYPLEANLLTDTPANMARAFDVLFAGCAADPACQEAYPELETVFWETVDQLNEEKIILPLNNLLTGESYDAYFAGDDLIGVLFQSLYSTEIIPDLPKLIYDINQGQTTNLSALLSSFLLNSEFISIGMQFSVQCNEENSFAALEEVEAAAELDPRLSRLFENSINIGAPAISICEEWGAGIADPIENEPISSDIPTLVLAGEYDPITPPVWGQLVADALSNSYYYEFLGNGHGVSVSGDCAVAVIHSFLDEPNSEPDTACLADVGSPSFTITGGDAEPLTLIPFENSTFGIEGVVPEGWTEAAPGTYARGNSGLDQTVLLQQAAPGMAPDQLLSLLSSQLGWEEVPESTSTYEDSNGRTWTLYEADIQGFPGTIAFTESEGLTLFILLITSPEDQEFLTNELFIPAMDALIVSE